jgi:hypothetical protein
MFLRIHPFGRTLSQMVELWSCLKKQGMALEFLCVTFFIHLSTIRSFPNLVILNNATVSMRVILFPLAIHLEVVLLAHL